MSTYDIAIPKEIKPQEGRVALMPTQVKILCDAGYSVAIEHDAGKLSGVSDADYNHVGATVLPDMKSIYDHGTLIMKVKEFLPPEYDMIRSDHILLTNIHPAADAKLVDVLLAKKTVALAAEDMHQFGSPNCALAGEVGTFEGIRLCFAAHGGTGHHFFPHFGSSALKVAVIGLGNVGRGCLRLLLNLGCDVVGFDISDGIRYRTEQDWDARNFSTQPVSALTGMLGEFDLILNCVLWPKHRGDHLISRDDLKLMKPNAVITDISCDEGGAIETSRPTKWEDPTYIVDGIKHFVVDNIPGAVPMASSAGYGASLMPHLLNIMEKGWQQAARDNSFLAKAVVCADGVMIHHETSQVQGRDHTPVADYLKN